MSLIVSSLSSVIITCGNYSMFVPKKLKEKAKPRFQALIHWQFWLPVAMLVEKVATDTVRRRTLKRIRRRRAKPDVEAPVGDFFASCFGERMEVVSAPVVVEDGDTFEANALKKAREIAESRQEKTRDSRLQRQQAAKLDNMFESMTAGEKKTLNVVVKADVRGSLEAIQTSLLDLGNEEVQVNIVSGGVGGIAETDVTLAITSEAVIFGFNVRADNAARKLVESEGVDLRYYNVIYDLIDDVKQALSGMLPPELREEIVGIAEVRDVFRSPKFGQIAGCMVTEGTVYRSKPIRVLRDNVVIYEGELESLRRFKDDAVEVKAGMECGIGVKNYTDVKVGDLIEVYEVKEIARSL